MSAKKQFCILAITIIVLSGVAVNPAVAQSDGNIICDADGNTTSLGSLMKPLVTLIITMAALIAVVGGAGYTMASAARPEEEKYVKNRNKSVLYGGGALLVLIGSDQLIQQLASGSDSAALQAGFTCVLPV